MKSETLTALRAIIASDMTASPEEVKTLLAALSPTAKKTRQTCNAAQAAEVLGCHKRTLQLYGKRGMLHPIRISPRKIRWDLGEVKQLAGVEYSSNAVQPQQPAAAPAV